MDTARVFALWVRAVCIWCFWSVVGAVALTGAFVAVRCVWSFAQIVLQAVGVQ